MSRRVEEAAAPTRTGANSNSTTGSAASAHQGLDARRHGDIEVSCPLTESLLLPTRGFHHERNPRAWFFLLIIILARVVPREKLVTQSHPHETPFSVADMLHSNTPYNFMSHKSIPDSQHGRRLRPRLFAPHFRPPAAQVRMRSRANRMPILPIHPELPLRVSRPGTPCSGSNCAHHSPVLLPADPPPKVLVNPDPSEPSHELWNAGTLPTDARSQPATSDNPPWPHSRHSGENSHAQHGPALPLDPALKVLATPNP